MMCLSAALARDQVAATIKECVCVCDARQDLFVIISSEPTAIVRTPYLEDPDGSQLSLCPFINTWTQGQDDVSGMGKRMKHLKDYMFWFLRIGQLKVFEYIFRPQHRGFQNRVKMWLYPGNVMEYDFQDSQRSMHLIHDAHDCMHRIEMPRIRKPYYSRQALSMWYQFKQGVVDWIENH